MKRTEMISSLLLDQAIDLAKEIDRLSDDVQFTIALEYIKVGNEPSIIGTMAGKAATLAIILEAIKDTEEEDHV